MEKLQTLKDQMKETTLLEETAEDEAEKIIAAGIETVQIRTVLNCKTHHGVCSKCYGKNSERSEPRKYAVVVIRQNPLVCTV